VRRLAAAAVAVGFCVAVLTAASERVTVPLHTTVVLQRPAVTAAYAVNPSIADVATRDGNVAIYGRDAGSTQLVVVTPQGLETCVLEVVAPAAGPLVSLPDARTKDPATWQSLYSSDTTRLTNTFDTAWRDGARTTQIHVTDVTQLRGDSLSARSGLPSVSFEQSTSGHDLVLGDRAVDLSPLTLEGTSLRGIHYRGRALEIHAGYTSSLLLGNLFLPAASETAVGASYRLARGRSLFTPNVYYYGSDSRSGGTLGPMTSLMYERGTPSDRFRVRGEAGYGRAWSTAVELAYTGEANQLAINARQQPEGFSSLREGRPAGSNVDASWNSRLSSSLTFNASGSSTRQLLRPRAAMSAIQLRYQVGPRWSATAGAASATFTSQYSTSTVRTVTAPIDLSYDVRRVGITGQYRYQRNAANNQGGSGGRLAVRGRVGAVTVNGFADYQKDAPSVDVLFRDVPDLARLFTELGLTARTPQDVMRLLLDEPSLAASGYIQAVTFTLQPSRLLTGADVTWASMRDARQQLQLHLVSDRTRTSQQLQTTTNATLSYSRGIGQAVDLSASVSAWARDAGNGAAAVRSWSFGIGARVRIKALPLRALFARRGAIRGTVYRDDAATGVYGPGLPRVAGVHVSLDGLAGVVTGADGAFIFEDASAGVHRVEVTLPAIGTAYFTTASSATVNAGETATFGVAYSAARLTGLVRDDDAAAVVGLRLRLRGPDGDETTLTDSDGRFRFSVAPAEYMLVPDPDSLAAGYELSTLAGRSIRLTRGAASQSDYVVTANRSISGVVRSANPSRIVIWLVELNRSTESDDEGHYVFRGLKPGTYTVSATVDGVSVRREIHVPAGPASIQGVDLDARQGSAGRVSASSTRRTFRARASAE
jgi:hypothetical protein